MMFRGEYNHTIDAKGRTIVPAKLREGLGDSFVMTKGLDGCLMAYNTDEWNKFEEKLQELPISNPNARKIVRHFSGGAADAECDNQGRILIPANLREYAKLAKDAVFVGMGNRVEIWSREVYDEFATYDDMDQVAAALEEMGLRI